MPNVLNTFDDILGKFWKKQAVQHASTVAHNDSGAARHYKPLIRQMQMKACLCVYQESM